MVFDLVSMFLLSQPHRLTLLGRVLYRGAALLVLAGLMAQAITSAMRHTQSTGSYRLLNDVWPNAPTWWIPETVVGMIGVVSLGAIGLAIAYRGRRFDRRCVG